MNLADAFRNLDHDALDSIYDNLPFVRTLSQDPRNGKLSLRERQAALAESLLIARDSFSQTLQDLSGTSRRGRLIDQPENQPGSLNSLEDESSSDDSDIEDDIDDTTKYEQDQELEQVPIQAQEPVPTSSVPHIRARTSSTKYQPYESSLLGHSNTAQPMQARHTSEVPAEQRQKIRNDEYQALLKSTVFAVPPTVNPYDPKKDHLPQWLKRTYMYWRWTLKHPIHEIPQRYAVWIALHLNDPSIRYHLQNMPNLADEGRFTSSVEVNDYILRKAAGHIKIQEDLARIEFNRLIQRENSSVIAFNSNYLRIFNKVRHYYHPERLAIQYYDRILPRIRKRLNVNFYEHYTSAHGNTKPRSFPTLEGLMLAAEQVDDFYRPLPQVPKKPGFFESMTQRHHMKKSSTGAATLSTKRSISDQLRTRGKVKTS